MVNLPLIKKLCHLSDTDDMRTSNFLSLTVCLLLFGANGPSRSDAGLQSACLSSKAENLHSVHSDPLLREFIAVMCESVSVDSTGTKTQETYTTSPTLSSQSPAVPEVPTKVLDIEQVGSRFLTAEPLNVQELKREEKPSLEVVRSSFLERNRDLKAIQRSVRKENSNLGGKPVKTQVTRSGFLQR